MASGIATIVAVPRGVSLGRQRQSLHFSRGRSKEGRRADARVSNQFTAKSQAEAASLKISAAATRFHLAAAHRRNKYGTHQRASTARPAQELPGPTFAT